MRPWLFILMAACLSFSSVRADEKPPATDRLPGVDLAEGVTQLTGVAISPLLGLSAVGSWQYYHAPEAQRARLPWFCQPYAWGTGFCLLGLCFLKDLFGTIAPPLLKKPFDVAELFENKVSALIACSSFVPFVVSELARHSPLIGAISAPAPSWPLATAFPLGVLNVDFIAIPLAVVCFLVVWLACHSINVVIALCPVGFIDGMLKIFKSFIIATVVVSACISPYLGAAVSMLILFIAGLLAPWAFRLTVFGTLFGFDVLLPARARRFAQPSQPHAFLARRIGGVPVRTYGRLTKVENGSVMFAYRPWLVFPERSLNIKHGNLALSKGLLFPSLLQSFDEKQRRVVVIFLPRYRLHESSIASHFEIVDILDSPLIKGFRAARTWLAEVFSSGKPKEDAIQRAPVA